MPAAILRLQLFVFAASGRLRSWLTVLGALLAVPMFGKPEVYVWQRQWTPEVSKALTAIEDEVEAVHVLAAEVRWRNGREEVFRAAPDYAALKKLRTQVGLVLRIGPYEGPFGGDDGVSSRLSALIVERLATARAAGIEPVEIQIDFDCAESKLAGYREWLGTFRRSVSGVRLVFTALPAWLRHEREFQELARCADGFVLQVHSLRKPREVSEAVVLCDPDASREWAEQASSVGVPFRISLPTYGYDVGFASDGMFIGLAADGSRRSWPEGTQVRVVQTDAVPMQALAQSLENAPLANCRGIVWFRLPVDGDRLNWDMRTLLAVMRNQPLDGSVRARVVWSEVEPGLAEIFLENTGVTTRAWPNFVELSWPEAVAVQTADSLAQYALDLRAGAREVRFTKRDVRSDAGLRPGRRARVGWMRFPYETLLQIKLVDEPAPR